MIIFDLDGTLRNNAGSELHVPAGVNLAKNWVAWQKWVNENGTVIPNVAKLYRRLCCSESVAIATSSQFGTHRWLANSKLPRPNRIVHRDPDDNRLGYEYKCDIIDDPSKYGLGHSISLWVDDDAAVCDYAESKGILVIRVKVAE